MKNEKTGFSGSSPALSLVSSDTAELLSILDDKQRALFYKVLRSFYDSVLPAKSFTEMGGILSCFWMIDKLKNNPLTASRLALLTLIYYTTKQGTQLTTTTELNQFSGDTVYFVHNNIVYLKNNGYILRYRFKNGVSQGSSPGASGKYIGISPKGLNLIKSLHSELREMIYNTHIKAYKLPH